MPRAIAIETSGRVGSIAVVEGGRVLREEVFEHGLSNAAKILLIIDALCREQEWKPGDIEEAYLSIGPGSFTGLRIAVTIAKTMAFANGTKLVAVQSARVLAENAPPDARNIVIVLDAKRGQIFTARYERYNDEWREIEPPHLDTLAAVIARSPRPIYLIGEGIDYHRDAISPNESVVIITDKSCWRGSASVVAKLGYLAARRGEFVDPDRLVPLYIRLPEAEEKLLAQNVLSPLPPRSPRTRGGWKG